MPWGTKRQRIETSVGVARRKKFGKARKYRSGVPLPQRAIASASTQEIKYVSVANVSASAVGTAGTFVWLNPIAQGDDIGSRTGRRTCCKSIEARLYLAKAQLAAATFAPRPVRVIIFADLHPNGVAPTLAELLSNAGGEDFMSMPNLNYRDRFQILFDQTPIFGMQTVDAGPATNPAKDVGPDNVYLHLYKRINIPQQWTATTAGSIADLSAGALYLLYITDVANEIAVNYHTRVRFSDHEA